MKCASCNKSFTPKTKRSTLCYRDDCIRQRERAKKQSQRGVGKVVELVRNDEPVAPVDLGDESIRSAVIAELAGADRLNTVQGRSAVVLAKRIDMASLLETGSSLAALNRELRATVEAALAGALTNGPVDELRQKRLERLGKSG